jgi:hypothetical protein
MTASSSKHSCSSAGRVTARLLLSFLFCSSQAIQSVSAAKGADAAAPVIPAPIPIPEPDNRPAPLEFVCRLVLLLWMTAANEYMAETSERLSSWTLQVSQHAQAVRCPTQIQALCHGRRDRRKATCITISRAIHAYEHSTATRQAEVYNRFIARGGKDDGKGC